MDYIVRRIKETGEVTFSRALPRTGDDARSRDRDVPRVSGTGSPPPRSRFEQPELFDDIRLCPMVLNRPPARERRRDRRNEAAAVAVEEAVLRLTARSKRCSSSRASRSRSNRSPSCTRASEVEIAATLARMTRGLRRSRHRLREVARRLPLRDRRRSRATPSKPTCCRRRRRSRRRRSRRSPSSRTCSRSRRARSKRFAA